MLQQPYITSVDVANYRFGRKSNIKQICIQTRAKEGSNAFIALMCVSESTSSKILHARRVWSGDTTFIHSMSIRNASSRSHLSRETRFSLKPSSYQLFQHFVRRFQIDNCTAQRQLREFIVSKNRIPSAIVDPVYRFYECYSCFGVVFMSFPENIGKRAVCS